MGYTIGQISESTGLSIHTLRYYEKEGIMPHVKRNDSGIRVYEKDDVAILTFICCLRETGMPVADIKRFVRLIQAGDHTIDERIVMLNQQKENILAQVDQLLSYMNMLDEKINFYKNR